MEMAIHKHDCDRCKFLGSFNGQDLYYCPAYDPTHPKTWTLISRFGSNGDYCSGGWKTNHPQMIEARRRAVKAGYIKWDEYT